jgi:hypothetical protein
MGENETAALLYIYPEVRDAHCCLTKIFVCMNSVNSVLVIGVTKCSKYPCSRASLCAVHKLSSLGSICRNGRNESSLMPEFWMRNMVLLSSSLLWELRRNDEEWYQGYKAFSYDP